MPHTPTRLISPYGSDRLVRLAAKLRPALCDTLITVGGLEFPAHSLVLAGASPRLGCRGRWALGEGISPSTFAQLLTLVYGESVELRPGDLGNLEEAARALGVQALEEACQRAQEAKREDELDPGLEQHQQSKLMRSSERGLGGPGEKQKPGKGTGEQELFPRHRAPRESSEMPGVTRKMRPEEALGPAPVGCRGAERQQEATGGPGGLRPPAGEGQPALWSILLWPPRYGTPFSQSTPVTAAGQVWPQDQRIPLTLNHSKGLWSQNPLAPCSPTPGTLATCVGQERTLSCPSRQHPPLPSAARSRPYSCSVCGKRFSLKHQMETHYRVHTGEKPFSCSLCPQRSRDFSAMTKHLRTHGAAPYRCPLCRAGCPSLAAMQAHMRGHPPSQLPPGWTIRSTPPLLFLEVDPRLDLSRDSYLLLCYLTQCW